MTAITMNDALERAGAGAYQRRLMGIFGLVWAADAMQVLAVGFTAASIAATFGLTVPQALQTIEQVAAPQQLAANEAI